MVNKNYLNGNGLNNIWQYKRTADPQLFFYVHHLNASSIDQADLLGNLMTISLKLNPRSKQATGAQINTLYVKKIFFIRDHFVNVRSVKSSVKGTFICEKIIFYA
ncbi:hypothetical protein SAMN05216387_101444 [Nitrosovibrio tenuis]|uniref:Uncharacterized protein n=1 Tax=Nitrosovibrio tenuis TaxID=1233 RepID=A0A1H7H2V7_9PROT|nr:hypothetical protein SAMN05216387_101444 [Nitrosovibrio tenuis]